MSKKTLYKIRNEPTMSDRTILIRVEDLISATFGSTKESTVDFKLLHKVFSILARQMRVLEQEVEIKADEYGTSPDGVRSYKDESSDGRGGDSSGDEYGRKRATFATGSDRGGLGGKRTAIGSINVVTTSEYNSLRKQLQQLQAVAVPPRSTLPQDKHLRKGLAEGTATMSEAMNVTQLSARVAAAESTVDRLIALLTQLVVMGVIPADILASLGIDVALKGGGFGADGAGGTGAGGTGTGGVGAGGVDDGAADSKRGGSGPAAQQLVTEIELTNSLESLQQELMQKVRDVSVKAMAVAKSAAATVKVVFEKKSIIDNLAGHISVLHSRIAFYAEQLRRFGTGVAVQIAAFEKEIAQLSSDLKAGLDMFSSAESAEAEALQDLKQRCGDIDAYLTQAMNEQKLLFDIRNSLVAELVRQERCVKTLIEQKVDSDVLYEELNDKIDLAALDGLLADELFEEAKSQLETDMSLCNKTFYKHDRKWFQAIRDLRMLFGSKAQYTKLQAVGDSSSHQLTELRNKLDALYVMLGDPKIAELARRLSVEGRCGACAVATLMLPEDVLADLPQRLPAARGPKLKEGPRRRVKELDWGPYSKMEARLHMCFRYVGGSHTLLHGPVKKPQHPQVPPVSSRKYAAAGDDGQLYMWEDIYKTCVKCNDAAAGDSAVFQQADNNGPMYNEAGDNADGDTGKKHGDEKKKGGNDMVQIEVIYQELPGEAKNV